MLKLQDRSLDWALKHIEKYGDTEGKARMRCAPSIESAALR